MTIEVDVIGGFPYASPNCKGCGKLLTVENAWMSDGCPCNSKLGINSMSETRWRLLMQLQQEQSQSLAAERRLKDAAVGALKREWFWFNDHAKRYPNASQHNVVAAFTGRNGLDRATFDELGISDAGDGT